MPVIHPSQLDPPIRKFPYNIKPPTPRPSPNPNLPNKQQHLPPSYQPTTTTPALLTPNPVPIYITTRPSPFSHHGSVVKGRGGNNKLLNQLPSFLPPPPSLFETFSSRKQFDFPPHLPSFPPSITTTCLPSFLRVNKPAFLPSFLRSNLLIQLGSSYHRTPNDGFLWELLLHAPGAHDLTCCLLLKVTSCLFFN
jgi:hypothetical protein